MPKLPSLTGKQLIRALKSLDFQVVRTRGSHHFLAHSDGRATVVPVHAGETIGPGLIAKILRDCEIDRDDLGRVL
ncbi:MAG: type II toxin-antitoxin system HicA family toxin [Thermoanaerobaculia bacterium]